MEQGPVLDDALVAELRDIMGTDYPTLVHAWLRDAEQRSAELQRAQATDNREDLRRVAHTLKGSSSNLGAVRVAECCALLEQKAQILDPEDIRHRLALMEASIVQAGEALQATLKAD